MSETISIIKADIDYYTGYYDDTRPEYGEKMKKEAISCTARFCPENCLLRLFEQRGPQKKIRLNDPLEVFDMGIAEMLLKTVSWLPALLRRDAEERLRVCSITNIPGQGVKNIILVFPTGKKASTWIGAVKLAQKNVGIASMTKGTVTKSGTRRLSVDQRVYCEGLQAVSQKFGVKAIDVINKKMGELEKVISEKEKADGHLHVEMISITSKCQTREKQLDMKKDEIQELKRKIHTAAPQRRYKYIVPFGAPHVSEQENQQEMKKGRMVTDDTAKKVANNRRMSRVTDWKQFELMCQQEVVPADLIHLAKSEGKKAVALAV